MKKKRNFSLGFNKSKTKQLKNAFSFTNNKFVNKKKINNRFQNTMEINVSYFGYIKNKFGIYKGKISSPIKEDSFFKSIKENHPKLNFNGVKFDNILLSKMNNEFSYLNFEEPNCSKKYQRTFLQKDKPLFLKTNIRKILCLRNNLLTNKKNILFIDKNKEPIFLNDKQKNHRQIKTAKPRSNRLIRKRTKSYKFFDGRGDTINNDISSDFNLYSINFEKALRIKKITEDELSWIKRGFSSRISKKNNNYMENNNHNFFNHNSLRSNNIIKKERVTMFESNKNKKRQKLSSIIKNYLLPENNLFK